MHPNKPTDGNPAENTMQPTAPVAAKPQALTTNKELEGYFNELDMAAMNFHSTMPPQQQEAILGEWRAANNALFANTGTPAPNKWQRKFIMALGFWCAVGTDILKPKLISFDYFEEVLEVASELIALYPQMKITNYLNNLAGFELC